MKHLALFLACLFAVSGCSNASTSQGGERKPAVGSSADDPKAVVANAALVLDVRTPEEFATGHLDRAVNIPVDQVQQRTGDIDKLVGGDRSKKIAVYCAAGRRAARAKSILEAASFTNVANAGGYTALR